MTSAGSRDVTLFIVFGICFALTMGANAVILPLLLSEMLGLKRYGTIMGLMNASAGVGLAIGAVVAGRIVDVTHSYTMAFEFAAVIAIAGAIAAAACNRPAAEMEIASLATPGQKAD